MTTRLDGRVSMTLIASVLPTRFVEWEELMREEKSEVSGVLIFRETVREHCRPSLRDADAGVHKGKSFEDGAIATILFRGSYFESAFVYAENRNL